MASRGPRFLAVRGLGRVRMASSATDENDVLPAADGGAADGTRGASSAGMGPSSNADAGSGDVVLVDGNCGCSPGLVCNVAAPGGARAASLSWTHGPRAFAASISVKARW